MFEDHPAAVGDGARQRREVFPRVEARLAVEADAGDAGQRHLLDERGVEAERRREHRLLAQRGALVCAGRTRERGMQVARSPLEAARDLEVADDRVDLSDRRQTRFPRRLRVIASETLHQFRQPRVGHHRQVRGRVPRVDVRAALALEQRDAAAVQGQQIRGGQAGDAAADDDDVDLLVAVELGKSRQRRGIDPVRLSRH